MPDIGDPMRPPPFRASPYQPDEMDAARVAYAKRMYHAQDDVRRPYEREVEDNVKMLAGHQWTVYNQMLGQYLDVSRWMDDAERRWRQRPVINRLLYWFMLTTARLTENPAIISYLPATADEMDARLAEVADPIAKYLWRCGQIDERHEAMMTWLAAAGEAYMVVGVDPNRGDWETWEGPAVLTMETPQGPIKRVVERAPYGPDGQPLVQMNPDGSYSETGEPHVERQGEIIFTVPCPLQVRGEWGDKPWEMKAWHAMLGFVRTADIEAQYGVRVPPTQSSGAVAISMELSRMMLGSGYYGAAAAMSGAEGVAVNAREGRAAMYTLFEAPVASNPEMAETQESPGGRMLVVAGDTVLYDGPRPARYPYTSPIVKWDFVKLPGRNTGTTPLEMLKPLQRSYNRGAGQIMEHRNLQCNPILQVDLQSGIKPKSITNRPGQIVYVNRRPSVPALDYVNPPPLPGDVWRIQEWMKAEMREIGNIEGAEGAVPSADASGELVNQLRANSDRFLGPALRRAPLGYARLIETAFSLVPVVWPREKIITVAGEDNAMQTITVLPQLFEYGKVNLVADISSMLPETRSEREARITKNYELGVYGPPGTPEAAARLAELLRFPHTQRALLPGGRDVMTARDENKRLFQGMPAQQIPLFEWYDDLIHLQTHEEYMKSTAFLELPPPIQMNFAMHRQMHLERVIAAQAAQMKAQLELTKAGAAADASGKAAAQPAPSSKGASAGGSKSAA